MLPPFYTIVYFDPEGYRKILITEIYQSEKIRRFRVAGKNRSIVLEKALYKGKNTWKIIEGEMKEEKVLVVGRAIDNKMKAK